MSRASQFRRRRGQALVEFALIALVLAVMLGAMLSLGHMFFAAHTIQQAVDVAAQEIARTPFPAASELGLGSFVAVPNSVMETELFREQIFDERHLVIDPQLQSLPGGEDDEKEKFTDVNGDGNLTLEENAFRLPLLNRLLLSAFIVDTVYYPPGAYDCDDPDRFLVPARTVYRYPGAIVEYNDTYKGETTLRHTIIVPLLGPHTVPDYIGDFEVLENVVQWVKPVEEIQSEAVGPYSVAATNSTNVSFQPGTVALRINYPFQAAGLVRYVRTQVSSPSDPNLKLSDRVSAVESNVNAIAVPGNKYRLSGCDEDPAFTPQGESLINSGLYGLGRTASFRAGPNSTKGVRPYRRVISAQAIYRREVFE